MLDLDGTVYPARSPFGVRLDQATTSYLVARSGLTGHELKVLEATTPSILAALGHLQIPRREWADAVHATLPYYLLRPDFRVRAALTGLDARVAIVTLSPAAHAERVLAALNLADLVHEVHSVFEVEEQVKESAYARLLADTPGSARATVGDNALLDLAPALPHPGRLLLVDPAPSAAFTSPARPDRIEVHPNLSAALEALLDEFRLPGLASEGRRVK